MFPSGQRARDVVAILAHPAIVEVDVHEAHVPEPEADELVGDVRDDRLVDAPVEGIPTWQ